MQWFNSKKSNAWIAMRNSGENTYIAQVTPRENAKPLVTLAQHEINHLKNADDIKKIVSQFKLNQFAVNYLLELDQYQYIQLDKPKVPKEELKEAVRWQLKDLISFPVEDISLDVIEIPNSKQNPDNEAFVYAMFSQNALIGEISNRLLNTKMNLKAIDTRIMAQRNIAKLLAKNGEGEALLSFTKSGALLTFTFEGEVCNARFIEISDANSPSSFEKISLELQRSLDGFEAKFRHVFIKKLLVAPFDLREQFCEHLRESIYTKVETFELEDIFEFAPNVDIGSMARQASFLPVLGAAMRDEVAA